MRVAQAVQQLMAVIERHQSSSKGEGRDWLLTEDSLCVGLARVGTPSQQIIKGKLKGKYSNHCHLTVFMPTTEVVWG